jgi:hypothetical protein
LTRQLLSAIKGQSMSVPSAWPQVLNLFGTPLVIEPSPGPAGVIRKIRARRDPQSPLNLMEGPFR